MRNRVVALCDLPFDPDDPAANRRMTQETCAEIVARGAIPLALGSGDSEPLTVLHTFELYPDLTVLQIDTHPDWRDEIDGERYGLSSGMQQASELFVVRRIIQVGMRGFGSAGDADIRDTLCRFLENLSPVVIVHTHCAPPPSQAVVW